MRKTAEDKMKSKHLFAINAEVRYKKIPRAVFFIIADKVLIIIYQTNNTPMF